MVDEENWFSEWEEDLSDSKKKGEAILNIAKQLEELASFKTMKDNEEMYSYNAEKGIYEHDGEVRVKEALQRYLPRITRAAVTEILEKVRMRNYVLREEFDNDPNLINTPNGLLNIYTRELTEHSPEHLSLTFIPVNYKKPSELVEFRGKVPRFMTYLQQTLDTQGIRTIAKMFGLILMRTPIYEIAFMFLGEGANGKSTMIDIANAMVGDRNISTVSLREIDEDRFAKAQMFGKMINAIDDLEEPDKIKHTSTLKSLISGKLLTAQDKHEKQFQFKNHAVIIIGANQPPSSKDKTYAFARRWNVIPFYHTFQGEDKEEGLSEKIIKNEMAIVLNFALGGIQLLKKEGFKEVDINKMAELIDIGINRAQPFIDKMCEKDPSYITPQKVLQQAYFDYCKKEGSEFVNYTKFDEHLKALDITIQRTAKTGKYSKFYKGVKLKAAVKERVENQTTLLG